jgi:hypothetical protein
MPGNRLAPVRGSLAACERHGATEVRLVVYRDSTTNPVAAGVDGEKLLNAAIRVFLWVVY